MADEYYESVKRAIHAQATARRDKESVFWDVIEGTAAMVDTAAGTQLGSGVKAGKTILNKARGKTEPGLVPNPWFVVNGHEGGSTSYTQKLLKSQAKKNRGAMVVNAAAPVVGFFTQVDVIGAVKHGNAIACSVAHIQKLSAFAGGYRKSKTLQGWFNLLIKMKMLKVGARGTQFAGAVVPIGAVGLATDLGRTAFDMGIKLTMTKVCLAAAADIHWRAFQEQAISKGLKLGGGGKVGPASKMVYEVFKQRGITSVFSQKNVDKIIQDPAGWLVLYDKIMLI